MVKWVHNLAFNDRLTVYNQLKNCLFRQLALQFSCKPSFCARSGLTAQALKDVCDVVDLRNPAQLYPQARLLNRHVTFHAGPTNSGKTHHALREFFAAQTGIYCGPLRMLAAEIYQKANREGVLCDMITGEERRWAKSPLEPSGHLSCTVEMCSTSDFFHVGIIDEIQMLRCEERGWAWSRALLGLKSQRIHVCGEEAAIDIVTRILSDTRDVLEVKHYERLTPLKFYPKNVGSLEGVVRGDCVVAFSQRQIFQIRELIESKSALRCAVIYGNLPPSVRLDQARQFNLARGNCDVLVASDAIGMGINLNIRRVIFHSLTKFDGKATVDLTAHHAKQIAGRAGRYGTEFSTGLVTAHRKQDMKKLKHLLETPNEKITAAGITPTIGQLEVLGSYLPNASLCQLLTAFEDLVLLDSKFFLCDIDRLKVIADALKDIPLTLQESYTFALAPVSAMKSSFVLKVLVQLARLLSEKKVVMCPDLQVLIGWPPSKFPHTLHQLQRLEYMHECCDLYKWLSYRFESFFVDRDEVVAAQKFLESIITRAVKNNLKYKRTSGRRTILDENADDPRLRAEKSRSGQRTKDLFENGNRAQRKSLVSFDARKGKWKMRKRKT